MQIMPWRPFLDIFDEMDNQFTGFVPATDVYEDKENVFVETTLAGIDPKDVSIQAKDDILTIEGKRSSHSEVEEKNYYRKEVRTGSFHRTVALPAAVKAEQAKAEFKNGLLKITLPKETKAISREIKIDIK